MGRARGAARARTCVEVGVDQRVGGEAPARAGRDLGLQQREVAADGLGERRVEDAAEQDVGGHARVLRAGANPVSTCLCSAAGSGRAQAALAARAPPAGQRGGASLRKRSWRAGPCAPRHGSFWDDPEDAGLVAQHIHVKTSRFNKRDQIWPGQGRPGWRARSGTALDACDSPMRGAARLDERLGVVALEALVEGEQARARVGLPAGRLGHRKVVDHQAALAAQALRGDAPTPGVMQRFRDEQQRGHRRR